MTLVTPVIFVYMSQTTQNNLEEVDITEHLRKTKSRTKPNIALLWKVLRILGMREYK